MNVTHANRLGEAVTLDGTSDDVVFFTETDGTQYAIDSAGDVYQVTYNGSYVYDPEASALMQNAGDTARAVVSQSASEGKFSFESLLASITNAIPNVLQFKLQNDLNKLNLERAARNQPPINPAQYAPGVNLGISPDTQKLLIYGGAATLGVMILSSVIGSRKR